MPQVIAAAAYWVGSTVATTLGVATMAVTGSAVAGVSVALNTVGFLTSVSELALWVGMSYAVDAITKPKLTPAGQELNFNMDPAYPREMIIGERLVGGSMAARYSRGSNLYNAHMVIQVADHPCTELSKVYDGGRVVWPAPLVHGVRTEIEAYSTSGGARVWMTWHDGRAGQTADTDLITKSAQDPDVVAGKLPGWSIDHRGAGCAYIHVEVQWDSDILTSIPQFQFLVKGAPLYDRRKDTTAGGSGSHRLDDPSTWEYTDNAAVAADHYLLGYKVEDDDLAFGIGLHPSEVPYEIFANAADLADEDVETGTGGDVETIKRYVVNGVVSAADYFEDVLEAFQIQMAARFVDLGGRIGILGAEERAISLDLTDQDLVADDQMQFADKLSFDDLYGSVSGTFADPANLYQQTPYETQYTEYNALPDGGEAQQIQIALPYEVHPRRAVRNVSAWLKRESLQPRLIGIFMATAWALEPGDWFTFSSERLQLDMAKFEVIDIAKHDDFTVTITARATDPEFLAFSVDDDPDLSVPPEVEPASLYLDAPEFDIEESSIADGDILLPAFLFTLTSDEVVAREVVIEYGLWVAGDIAGPTQSSVMHVDQVSMKLAEGVLPGKTYAARAKVRVGGRESPWTDWSAPIDAPLGYAVGEAASVEWENVQDGGGTRPDDNADVTSANTAAAITGQGGLATLNFTTLGTNVRLADGSTSATNALLVTSLGTAAAITSQGGLATLNFTTLGSNVRLENGTTVATNALLQTSLGTAAAIASQGAFATMSQITSATYLASGVVSPSRLVIGDQSNLLLDDFQDSSFWQSVGGTWTLSSSGDNTERNAMGAMNVAKGPAGNGTTSQAGTSYSPAATAYYARIEPGRSYRFFMRTLVQAGATTRSRFRIQWYGPNSSGVLAQIGSTISVIGTDYRSVAAASQTVQDLSTIEVAPTGADRVLIQPFMEYSTTLNNAGTPFFSHPRIYRQAQLGVGVTLENGTTLATNALLQTSLGTAAAITSQGGLATLSFVTIGTNLRRADGTTSATEALIVTSLGTASAITSQGALATLNTINSSSLMGAGVVTYTALATTAVRLGTNIVRNDGTTSVTDALVVTSLGTASAITGQGAFATLNTVNSSSLIGAGVVTHTALASTAVRLGTNIVRADGTTSATDAMLVTSLGVASAITGQGFGATASQATVDNSYIGERAPGIITKASVEDSGLGTWTGTGLTVSTGWTSLPFTKAFRITDNHDAAEGVYATVAPGEKLYASAWLRAAGTVGTVALKVEFRDAADSVVSTVTMLSKNDVSEFSFLQSSSPVTVPALACKARAIFSHTGGSSGHTAGMALPRIERHAIGADQTALNTAAAITSQGGLATLNFVQLGTNVRLADGSTSATNALLVTSLGTASAVTGQGALCTLSYVQFNSTVRLQNGTTVVTDVMVVTASGTAAAIAGQGGLATQNTVNTSTIDANSITEGDIYEGAETPGSPIASTSSWDEIGDVTLNVVSGAKVRIDWALFAEGSNSATSEGSYLEVKITRQPTAGGTEVDVYTTYAAAAGASFELDLSDVPEIGGVIFIPGNHFGHVSGFDSDAPSAAEYKYRLYVKHSGGALVGGSWGVSMVRLAGTLFKR